MRGLGVSVLLNEVCDLLHLPGVKTLLVFFFSSRRRHTILQGDGSSDVCSSDLTTIIGAKDLEHLRHNIAAARKRPLPADVVAEAYCYLDATGSRPEADTFWRTASAD